MSVRNLKNIFIILFQTGFISLEFLLYNLVFKIDAVMHSEVFLSFSLPYFLSNFLLLLFPKTQTDTWMVVCLGYVVMGARPALFPTCQILVITQ